MEKNETAILIVLILAFTILFSGFGMMGYGNRMGMLYWMFGSSFGLIGVFGLIFWIFIIIIVVLFIIWIIEQFKSPEKIKVLKDKLSRRHNYRTKRRI